MSIIIPDKHAYQPSSESLTKWLSTRKGDLNEGNLNVGGVTMPRYFSDVGYSKDQFWFIMAILGEVSILGLTLYYGAMKGGTFFLFATITVIMFIFCDFFFAYKLHRNKGDKCKLASAKLQLGDDDAAEMAKLRQRLNQGKIEDYLYQTGIIIIALFKVIGIMLLGISNELILYIPFAIIYFIVAYIHLQHTGYFFAYVAANNAIRKKDYNEFAKGELCQARITREMVSTIEPLRNLPVKHNPHEIVIDKEILENGGDEKHYVIVAKGVLTDEDIISLINGQTNENKIRLFKACRRLQMGNY